MDTGINFSDNMSSLLYTLTKHSVFFDVFTINITTTKKGN